MLHLNDRDKETVIREIIKRRRKNRNPRGKRCWYVIGWMFGQLHCLMPEHFLQEQLELATEEKVVDTAGMNGAPSIQSCCTLWISAF